MRAPSKTITFRWTSRIRVSRWRQSPGVAYQTLGFRFWGSGLGPTNYHHPTISGRMKASCQDTSSSCWPASRDERVLLLDKLSGNLPTVVEGVKVWGVDLKITARHGRLYGTRKCCLHCCGILAHRLQCWKCGAGRCCFRTSLVCGHPIHNSYRRPQPEPQF